MTSGGAVTIAQKMLRNVLCLSVLCALVLSTPSRAATISPQSGTSYPYQRWVDRVKVPTPDIALTVVESRCPSTTTDEAAACAQPGTTTIYVDPTVPWRHVVRRLVLHELGHQFDYWRLDDHGRDWFMRTARIPGPWQDPERGHGSPHELFAIAYEMCAEGRNEWRPGSDDEWRTPPVRPMARACYVIRHSG